MDIQINGGNCGDKSYPRTDDNDTENKMSPTFPGLVVLECYHH